MKSRRYVFRLAMLLSAGLVVALAAGLLIPERWQTATEILVVVASVGLFLTVLRRQTLSLQQLHRKTSETSGLSLLQLVGHLDRIEEMERLSEIRARQIGQLVRGTESGIQSVDIQLKVLSEQVRENELRIRQIGQLVKREQSHESTYQPLAQRHNGHGSQPVGRLAAAVKDDASRADRLLDIVGNSGFGLGKVGRRRVGIFGTPALQAYLGVQADTSLFLPSMSVAQYKALAPSTILLEEKSFVKGAWSGALSSGGIALYDEMQQVIDKARLAGASIYYLRNMGVADIHSRDLERLAYVIDEKSSFEEEWDEGMRLDFLESLRSYCGLEG